MKGKMGNFSKERQAINKNQMKILLLWGSVTYVGVMYLITRGWGRGGESVGF